MALHHVYGTNGIVLELEVALAKARFDPIARSRSFQGGKRWHRVDMNMCTSR